MRGEFKNVKIGKKKALMENVMTLTEEKFVSKMAVERLLRGEHYGDPISLSFFLVLPPFINREVLCRWR